MSDKMLQIRNIPAETHRRLKMRAAEEGMSMSDYVMREVSHALEVPTRREVIERLRAMPRRHLRPSPTVIVRKARDSQ